MKTSPTLGLRSSRIDTRLIMAVMAATLLVSCKHNPVAERQGYLEKGNKYFDAGKYAEAQIMYKSVCRKDLAWGPACYRLGLTDLKLGFGNDAAQALHNAVGLLPPQSPDHWAAMISLSDLYLAATPHDKQAMEEVANNIRQLLQHDPQSFDAHRLAGDLNYAQAYEQYQGGHREQWLNQLSAAIDEYRNANAIKSGQPGVVLQLARAMAAKGDPVGAEELYRSAIAADKSLAAAYVECYRLLMAGNKPTVAEQLLKEASLANPRQLEFLNMLAEHYLIQGRPDEMRRITGQIVAHANDFDQARLTTGNLYLSAGDREAAVREYRDGAAQDPKNAPAYLKRAVDVLQEQGKGDGAAEVNSQILKIDPKDIDARAMAVVFQVEKDGSAKATAELLALLKEAPDNITVKFNLGQVWFKEGNVEQARRQFEEAIKLRPTAVAPRLALAELQLTRGEFDPAFSNAEQVVAVDRNNTEARLIAAAAYQGQKKFVEARKLLNLILKADPSSAKGLLQLGELDLVERKYPEAEDAFRRSYRLNPLDARGLVGIADSWMARKMPDKAIATMQEEADKAPNRTDLHLALAATAMRAEKFDIAIREFQKALVQTGTEAATAGEIYLDLGESYRRKGDLNNAIQVLEDGSKAQPRNAGIAGELAFVLDKSGRKPEARAAYEAALKLNPDNAGILNNLAYLLAETGGNLDEALSKAQRARELQPDLDSALDTVGWIYLKQDNVGTAIRIFAGLVEKRGNRSTYHYHLAMALSHTKDRSHAIRELQEALRLNPESDEKEKIRQLLRSLS